MQKRTVAKIKLEDTEKKILKLKNEFKDLFYNNTKIKNLSVKTNLEEDTSKIPQKSRPISKHLQDQVADKIIRLLKNGYLG